MLNRVVISSFIVCCSIFISGCASIVNGETQTISVQTPPVNSAQCTLTNDKGEWFINSTPGSTVIHRSGNRLVVQCQKLGYFPAEQDVSAKVKPMVFGNALFGGVIGATVDLSDGAGYEYPTNIQVPMAPMPKRLK